jgi:hypothetical protein
MYLMFDETGGFQLLRSFVQSLLSNYFIIITLYTSLYIYPEYNSPTYIVSFEPLLSFLMLLIGIILFLITHETIRNVINKGINSEFEKINKKYNEIYDKVYEISFNKKINDNEKELQELWMVINLTLSD